jgi:hypothetical protein
LLHTLRQAGAAGGCGETEGGVNWWAILLVVVGFVPALALGIFITAFLFHWADASVERAIAKRRLGQSD